MPQGNNPADVNGTAENKIENRNGTVSGAAGTENNDAVSKAYHDVQNLREQIERLKAQAQKIYDTPAAQTDEKTEAAADRSVSDAAKSAERVPAVDPEAARAAEEAVRKAAEKDRSADDGVFDQQRAERQAIIQDALKREREAKERLEKKRAEAEEKKKALQEAERKAARMTTNLRKAEIQTELNRTLHAQEEKRALLKKKRELEKQERLRIAMEREKVELQKKEEARLEKERIRLKREHERQVRAQEAERRRNEAIRLRNEELKARKEIERLQAEERENLRRQKEERQEKIRRQREERQELLQKQREERQEIRRQRRFARKSAELGGGIVNVHGTTIKTEIKPVAAFSLKEFFGFSKQKEIKAAQTEEERQQLLEENARIQAEARATAAHLREIQQRRRQNSAVYKKAKDVFDFCERKKAPLLLAFSLLLVVAVGTAGLFNYFTAYEYSYGDKKLGYVKNKDDVLQITEMVRGALTEDKDMSVVLDPRGDIRFKRVFTGNKDIVIDTQDGVLEQLSYLGDINVKAIGIYVDGRKVGAVRNKDVAAEVLLGIRDRYANHDEGTVINDAVLVEAVEPRESNTPLSEVLTKDAMIDKLCTDTEKEIVHTVEGGETLESIAEDHGTTKEQIIAENNVPADGQLKVGSTLVLKEVGPLVTVRITETRTFTEKTAYKTIKKADDEMFEGETEVSRKGKKGKSQIVDKTVSINGEVVETQHLKNEVEKEPVDKIILVGTKERPPTTGTGTFIWPAYDGTYTITSEFKWRWGRQHEGIDMGCPTGTDVLASDGGTVVHAGPMGGYGNLVIIDHENGIETYYGHNSSLLVSRGDKVFQGQHIAEAGNTGHSFGSHIHFGVKDNGSFQNPRNYLPAR